MLFVVSDIIAHIEMAVVIRDGMVPFDSYYLLEEQPLAEDDAAALLPRLAEAATTHKDIGRVETGVKDIPALKREVEARSEVIKVAEAMVKRDGWYGQRDETENLGFGELAALKEATKLLCFRVRIRVAEGKLADAVEDMSTANRLADEVAKEPFLIGALVDEAMRLTIWRTRQS